jgi:dehydrogenase/reductase SDR family protein 12
VQSSLPAFHRLVGPILRTPEQGIDTTLWLSAEPDLAEANGRLWLDRHRRRTAHLPGTATSEPDARRLWDWCADRAGIDVLPGSSERPEVGANPAAFT